MGALRAGSMRFQISGFRAQGSGFRVQGAGFVRDYRRRRVWGFGPWARSVREA